MGEVKEFKAKVKPMELPLVIEHDCGGQLWYLQLSPFGSLEEPVFYHKCMKCGKLVNLSELLYSDDGE